MKEFAIDAHTTAEMTVAGEIARSAHRGRAAAYAELTKPRITFLIALTSAAGFCLGSAGPVDYALLLNTLLGVALLSSGIAALNQYMERDLDGLMRRTAARPLPSGRLASATASEELDGGSLRVMPALELPALGPARHH